MSVSDRLAPSTQDTQLDTSLRGASKLSLPLNLRGSQGKADHSAADSSSPRDGQRTPRGSLVQLLAKINYSHSHSDLPTGQREATLEELVDKGYMTLAVKLKEKKGFPWEDILRLNSPSLMEQLVSLHELLQLKVLPESNASLDKAMEWCLQAASGDASEVIGKIVFLTNKAPMQTVEKIASMDTPQVIAWVNEQFDTEIRAMKVRIALHVEEHAKSGFHPSDVAINCYIPIEISKALIIDTGSINIGIIPKLKEMFATVKSHSKGHENNVLHVLKLLKRSPKLRASLCSIEKPESPYGQANELIRIALGKAWNSPVTDVEARQAALCALLSHLRQGNVGSCFATYLAIEMLSSRLGKVLDDFKSLLKSSKLTRKINGVVIDFPFLIKTSHDALAGGALCERNGRLFVNGVLTGFLWDVPGIRGACRAMGIGDAQTAIQKALPKLFEKYPPTTSFIRVTANELLPLLAANAAEFGPLSMRGIATITARGSVAYDSQVHNPLLMAWENAIAGMAEAHENSKIKVRILSSICGPVNDICEKLLPPEMRPLAVKFSTALISRIHLQYDPLVKRDNKSADGRSVAGAFVLYDRSGRINPQEWKRVDNEQAFVAFLDRVFQDAVSGQEIPQTLSDHIHSPAFLEKIVRGCHLRNSGVKNILQNLHMVTCTPWITYSGNDSATVLKVYLEEDTQPTSLKLVPADAKSFLSKIIELGRKGSVEEKAAYEKNPNLMIPARIASLHAFSLMLGHPSIIKAWKEEGDCDTWINTYVVGPGKALSDSPVNFKLRLLTTNYAYSYLATEENCRQFLDEMGKIPKGMSIKQFRSAILDIINRLDPASREITVERARLLDTKICQYLSNDAKKQLEDSAVHFADTNWGDGVRDVHFCFLVNPGSGELEIWEANDNGSNLVAIDQHKWLLDKEWEIFNNISFLIDKGYD